MKKERVVSSKTEAENLISKEHVKGVSFTSTKKFYSIYFFF